MKEKFQVVRTFGLTVVRLVVVVFVAVARGPKGSDSQSVYQVTSEHRGT